MCTGAPWSKVKICSGGPFCGPWPSQSLPGSHLACHGLLRERSAVAFHSKSQYVTGTAQLAFNIYLSILVHIFAWSASDVKKEKACVTCCRRQERS